MLFRSRPQVEDAGLLWGAYHFGTGDDVAEQEEHFLTVAQPEPGNLVALDFEPNPPNTMSLAQAKDYLYRIQADLGRKAVL